MSDRSTLAPGCVGPNEIEPPTNLVELRGVTKAFGPTLAAADIDFEVAASDVVGLVGGNGAGKSTLMRILCGITAPTLGRLSFDGVEDSFANYDAGAAQRRGVRMVHQELSLCATLSVAENFFIEAPQHGSVKPGWRDFYRSAARAALGAVFPGNRIDADARIDRLSIGERQMVEIARATATPGVRLIVLDEPTSALDLERSGQLRRYVRERARSGLAFIFISHKLHEIMDVASRVLVLRNGRVAWQGAATAASAGKLVELMGGEASVIHHKIERAASAKDEVVRIGAAFVDAGASVGFHRGEIIGLAGLEGHGQKALLRAIYEAKRGPAGAVTRAADASFVSGDRQKEGVFPLWSVLANVSVGRVGPRLALGLVSDRAERKAAEPAAQRIRLDVTRFDSRIGELSGGNQQKALVSRAVAAMTPIVLLDDPTRGVDIATKQDFYRLCNELAREGRTLIWHTTEDAELIACDRVLVFANGKIVHELSGPALTEEAVVAASFSHLATGPDRAERSVRQRLRLLDRLVGAAPLLGLALVLAVMIAANPSVASVFGLDLLLLPALSLVLVTQAQMFVVGGAEIDLGVGAFAGLVSVLSATLLYDRPALGALAIAAVVIAYAMLGAVIQGRKIPAIVVTLGASFIWLGIGYSIQPTPGGASPDWLSALTGWSIPHAPTSIILIGVVAAAGALLDWAPLGVVLRGFGANPAAMIASGWPALRYGVVRYLIAGLFSAAAGLSLTAINSSSDINSGNSYTLLSVAAVVMGGCALTGGVVAPIGAVLGAVTLALIGALLGALGVSSDFNAAAQGAVLIGLLGMRHLADKSEAE